MKKTLKDYLFVGIQFLFFGLYAFDFFPKMDYPKIIANLGIVLAIFGFLIVLIALFELNTNLTVFPTPKNNATLITSGLYRYSRHPIYSGILLFIFGYAIFSFSSYRILIFVCLLIWFYLKSSYEELQLQKKFKNYSEYQKKVGRFF